jgi:hypothetical protein
MKQSAEAPVTRLLWANMVHTMFPLYHTVKDKWGLHLRGDRDELWSNNMLDDQPDFDDDGAPIEDGPWRIFDKANFDGAFITAVAAAMDITSFSSRSSGQCEACCRDCP